ncbi:cellulose-binding domain-containing protein [Micromonospora phytophila]|uniref:cellulose binding domain-containing protein n=1 Tax=Micromonospora phytophila TaxID=709888 RepID=UPI00202EB6BD|nr:cellulose binding domain-containing protein [Micromonospora phytophila]MCM0674376.1 cellulose-binding domain-containing protein [Micromonospora phytophila]
MSGTRRAARAPHASTAIASSPWIVVSIGVVVMVVMLVVALGAYRGRGIVVDGQPEPAPTLVLPELPPSSTGQAAPTPTPPVRPKLSPRASVPPTTGAATPAVPAGGGGATAPPAPRPAVPPAPPPVSGRYRVLESFPGGFIGEVLVRNDSRTDRGWTVRLAFPGGRVATTWVEGAPQGTMSQTEDGFSYRSGVNVAPGASVPLRFHIERADSRPASCTVDGGACQGL